MKRKGEFRIETRGDHSESNSNEFVRSASEGRFTGSEPKCRRSYGCIKAAVRTQPPHWRTLIGMRYCKMFGTPFSVQKKLAHNFLSISQYGMRKSGASLGAED